MPDQSFEFADYHRTVVGFHGTTAATAELLVDGRPFDESRSDDDWLGRGIYFWEYAPQQAWWWAREFKKHKKAGVVGALIRLGNCLDLLDPINLAVVKSVHLQLIRDLLKEKKPVPENARQHRNLDCAVFDYLCGAQDPAKAIESIRGVYVPTSGKYRVWKGSWLYEQAHIQINVKNPKNILAVWHIRADGHYGKENNPEPAAK